MKILQPRIGTWLVVGMVAILVFSLLCWYGSWREARAALPRFLCRLFICSLIVFSWYHYYSYMAKHVKFTTKRGGGGSCGRV